MTRRTHFFDASAAAKRRIELRPVRLAADGLEVAPLELLRDPANERVVNGPLIKRPGYRHPFYRDETARRLAERRDGRHARRWHASVLCLDFIGNAYRTGRESVDSEASQAHSTHDVVTRNKVDVIQARRCSRTWSSDILR